MFALEVWGIKPAEVRLLNMQPNQIAAAWERGDIDAAYVWDPALSRIKQSGKVLITSGELSKKGKATFDGIAAHRKWAEANQDFMVKFTKTLADLYAGYAREGKRWTADSPEVKAMVKLVGGEPKDVAEAVKLYGFPTAEEQASAAWLGGGQNGGAVRALKATAEFLKAQKSIDSLAQDYGRFVTSKYAEAAMRP
jgi:taurine transport system substrate-binding protein